MSAALAVLTSPPTSAPVVTRPVGGPGPGLAGWYRPSDLTDTDLVARLVTAYSRSVETRHRAVGAACGLQSLAGRLVVAALGLWVQTGALPDLRLDTWRVELDADGRTVAVSPPVEGAVTVPDAAATAAALLDDHLAPVIGSFREVGRITERLALGCVAASCAAVLARLHRRVRPGDRELLEALTADFLAAPAWDRAGRPLVTVERIEVRGGPALVTARHTCCLMRLGRDRRPCGTCPDLPGGERTRRTRYQATVAPRGTDLAVGVPDVA